MYIAEPYKISQDGIERGVIAPHADNCSQLALIEDRTILEL